MWILGVGLRYSGSHSKRLYPAIAPAPDCHFKLLIGSGHLGRNGSQVKRGGYVDKYYYSVFNVCFVNMSFIFLY